MWIPGIIYMFLKIDLFINYSKYYFCDIAKNFDFSWYDFQKSI